VELGDSRVTALNRFLKTESRFSKEPTLKAEYIKYMQQFQELGYIEPVPTSNLNKLASECYYIPHHVVVKPSSNTTKYRVVFDASAKSETGVSLNAALYTGPKLQIDLQPLLIRFMSYPVALSADIWKFYPQTHIHEDDRDFQRFLWREEPQLPIKELRMTRVTFGLTCAPFLAIRALHQLAAEHQEQYLRATQVIKEEFLVDNLLSGAEDVQGALKLKSDLLKIMEKGGLKLLQWTSNSAEVMKSIPIELQDSSRSLSIDEGETVKTIGILWNPKEDTFGVQISIPDPPAVTTKRTVLSTIARTFDPLGWLSPVTLRPKLLIQELWKANLSWDEPLPLKYHQVWRKYCEELPALQNFCIPRCAFQPPTLTSKNINHQIHGFSDGSNVAHAACVYIRTEKMLEMFKSDF
jgi:hypothetical protein